MTVLLDTGAIYAMADRDDAWHERVKSLLDQHPGPFLVPITVLPEACYLLNTHLGQEAERLNVRQIITTDRRDFSLVRPRHCVAFELLP